MTDREHLGMGVAVSVVAAALVMTPAFRDPSEDSFPLSTFPMFSGAKRDPDLVITQVLAVLPDGTRRPLPPELATGNEEVIQALQMIHNEAYGERKRATEFCKEVAARVRAAPDPWRQTKGIEIARSHFDTVDYFETGPEPVTRKVLKACPVGP
jgi:hypothetical protein